MKNGADTIVVLNKWEDTIVFKDGWFMYLDGDKNASVIGFECAKDEIVSFFEYQAGQDVDRGGMPPEYAYPGRGFVKNGNSDRDWILPETIADKIRNERIVLEPQATFSIPEKVGNTAINFVYYRAFRGNKTVRKLIVPPGIARIGREAFSDCDNLSDVEILPKEIAIENDAFAHTPFIQHRATGECQYVHDILLKAPENIEGSYAVREGTKVIGEGAFKNCVKLTGVIFPKGLRTIESDAFGNCASLRDVVFNEDLKIIRHAFRNCVSLAAVSLPASLEELGGFYGCVRLNNIEIPEKVVDLPRQLFFGCVDLDTITLHDNIRHIGFDCFENTKLFDAFSRNAKAKVLYLGKYLIDYKDNVKELVVKEGTLGFADEYLHFKTRKLENVVLPRSIEFLGWNSFGATKIRAIELRGNVRIVRDDAFRDCYNLEEVDFPESVERVGKHVFFDCTSLKRVTFRNPETLIERPCVTLRESQRVAIRGYKNSTAHAYARETDGLVFEELRAPQ